MLNKTITFLFEKAPHQWGLRGDPHLWNEMKAHFAQTPIPATEEELIVLIQNVFLELTNHPMSEKENFYIERFNHGGMSGGYVSPEFWRNKVIPLMREQFNGLNEDL